MLYFSRRCAGVALMLLTGAAYAATHDDALTLGEAQRIAITQSQKLLASSYARDAATELTHAAGSLPDPVLRMGVENVPAAGPDRYTLGNDSMTMTRIGVMQEFTRPSKRRLLTERANQSVAMAAADHALSLANVQRDTALAWLAAFYAEQQAHVIGEQVETLRAESNAVESAYAQGRGTSADVLATRGILALIEDQASDAAYKARAARIALTRFIGDDAQRPLLTRPAIDVLPPHVHGDAHLDEQLRLHPDLQLLERQQEVAETDAKIARAERRANWSVELSYGRRGAMFDDMLSLEVSVPLQINRGARQNRELASRLALASAAKAEREDMYREHLSDTRAMLDAWTTVRLRRESYAKNILPLAHDRSVAVEAAYRGGKATLEQVIAARRNEIDMSLQALQLEAEMARLWASLSFLSVTNNDSALASSPASGEEVVASK